MRSRSFELRIGKAISEIQSEIPAIVLAPVIKVNISVISLASLDTGKENIINT